MVKHPTPPFYIVRGKCADRSGHATSIDDGVREAPGIRRRRRGRDSEARRRHAR